MPDRAIRGLSWGIWPFSIAFMSVLVLGCSSSPTPEPTPEPTSATPPRSLWHGTDSATLTVSTDSWATISFGYTPLGPAAPWSDKGIKMDDRMRVAIYRGNRRVECSASELTKCVTGPSGTIGTLSSVSFRHQLHLRRSGEFTFEIEAYGIWWWLRVEESDK